MDIKIRDKLFFAFTHHQIDDTIIIPYEGLSGGRNNDISRTALRIIASMRRDWMQVSFSSLVLKYDKRFHGYAL